MQNNPLESDFGGWEVAFPSPSSLSDDSNSDEPLERERESLPEVLLSLLESPSEMLPGLDDPDDKSSPRLPDDSNSDEPLERERESLPEVLLSLLESPSEAVPGLDDPDDESFSDLLSRLPDDSNSDEPLERERESLPGVLLSLLESPSEAVPGLDDLDDESFSNLLSRLPHGEFEDPDCMDLKGEEATTDHLFDLSNQEWGELPCTEPPLPEGEPCESLLGKLEQSERESDSVLAAQICQRIENEEKIGRVMLENFTHGHAPWLVLNGVLCVYDRCYWRRLHNKDEAVVALRKILKDYPSLYQTMINSDYSNLYAAIKSNPDIPRFEVPPRHRGKINFIDGVLDLDSGEVLPHDPEQYFFSYINCSAYDVLFPPTNGEVFEAFVKRTGNGDPDVREQLLEQILMAFAELDLKYFGYLVGPSHTGKSQFGAWLEASLGPENIQVLRDINDFSDKWTPGSLDGKKLVACWDVPNATVSKTAIGYIKMLVGDDSMKGEKKYGDIFTIHRKPHLILASNYPLKIAEAHRETAFLNRVITIPFQNPVDEAEMKQNLYEELLHETPYILNQAMEAYHRFKARNFVPTRAAVPGEFQPQEGNQPMRTVEEFIKTSIVAQPDSKISTNALYHAFLEYSTKNGTIPMGEHAFSIIFSRAAHSLLPQAQAAKIGTGSDCCRGYKGICLRSEDQSNQEVHYEHI